MPCMHHHSGEQRADRPPVLMALVLGLLLSLLTPTEARLLAQTVQQQTAASTAAQGDKDVRLLEPGTPIERELAGGETHVYRIMLISDEYLHVAVDQRGIDVAVTLRGPDGVQLMEMEGLSGMLGEEELSWEAASSGGYLLEVRARAKEANTGRYEVRLQKAKAAGGKERARIAAERLYMEGRQAQAEQRGAALERAVKAYETAVAKWREAGERKWEGATLRNLGNVYLGLSQYEKARDYFEQALAITREIKDRRGEGNTLSNLGIVYGSLSQYEKARDYFEQALAITREIKDRRGEGSTLRNLGNVYLGLSQYEKARDYYEQALAITREIKNRDGEGMTLNNLGDVYHNLSQYEKAREYFEQALAIWREIKNRRGEGYALTNLGEVCASLNQHEKARDYFEQALAITREIKNRSGEGYALNKLGEVYASLNQHEKARDYFEQALAIWREIKERDGEGETLSNLMSLWKSSRRPRLAVFYGKQAVNAYQDIRSNIQGLEKESQRSFLKSKEDTYRQLADLLISEGRLPEAQQVLGLLKEEEYFQYLRRDKTEIAALARRVDLRPEEAAALTRYVEIADRITAFGSRFGELDVKRSRLKEGEKLLESEQAEFDKVTQDLADANRAFMIFLQNLAEEFTKSARFTTAEIEENRGLQADLQGWGAGTVALYTVVGEDRYRVILTTPQTQTDGKYEIKAAELNRKVLAFREAVQDPQVDPRPLAQELYNILIKPVEKDLQGARAKTLVWSLDGTLRYLPIAALHDGRQYMAERYQNVIITLASRTRLAEPVRGRWRGLGLGVSQQWENFRALPAVPQELRAIIRDERAHAVTAANTAAASPRRPETGVLPGRRLLDVEFTEQSFKDALGRKDAQGRGYSLVHIASHFTFRPGDFNQSFLLLGDGKSLTLDTIRTSPQLSFAGVEMLTLSACDTATAMTDANGAEVEGFGVLAQKRGAKAVLATLWPVVDASTREFMERFYRTHNATPGITKAEALQQAQVALLRGGKTGAPSGGRKRTFVKPVESGTGMSPALSPYKVDEQAPYSHPYFWAPFILIGNWR